MDIAEWRRIHGFTQREAAERLGVNIRTVQKWEGGERTPPPYLGELLLAIANKQTGEDGVAT